MYDLSLATRRCPRIVLIDRGRVVCAGTPETVMTEERLAEVCGLRAILGRAEGALTIQVVDRIG